VKKNADSFIVKNEKKEKISKAFDIALRDIDDAYIEEAADNTPVPLKRTGFRVAALAAALSLTVAIIIFSVFILLRGRATVDPQPADAPWKTGELHLTSVVFRAEEASAKKPGSALPFLLLTSPADSTALQPDQEVLLSDTVTVSVAPYTRISGFSGNDLMRVRLRSGDHADCDSIWYDIKNDKIVCLSCLIREAVAGDPDYTDACIRLAIESGMISYDAFLSGEAADIYAELYRKMDNESDRRAFSEGRSKSPLPSVSVLEYGTDPDKCLYTLTNADKTLAYGVFIFDFKSGRAVKLDASHTGVPECFSGILGTPEKADANLTLASDIIISDGYTRVIAEVPYYPLGAEYNSATGEFYPTYAASTVMVYTAGENSYSVFGDAVPKDMMQTPAGGLAEKTGTVSFTARNGKTAFSVDRGDIYFIDGQRLALLNDRDGRTAVIMEQDGRTVCYYPEKTGPLPADPDKIADTTLPFERGVIEDGVFRDLITGETSALTAGTPDALVRSRDGRFVYYYDRRGTVFCRDLLTGDEGAVEVGKAFENQLSECDDATVCLFIGGNGRELLLAYYRNGDLTFDREAYLASIPELIEKESFVFYSMTSDIVNAFNHNFETVLPFFRLDGNPIRITDTKRFTALGRYLSVAVLEKRLTPGMSEGNYNEISDLMKSPGMLADIAEAVIPYLEFTSGEAFITPGELRDAMNGITEDAFNERYFMLLDWVDLELDVVEFEEATPDIWKRLLARKIANDVVRRLTGYLSPDDEMRDLFLFEKKYAEQTGDAEAAEHYSRLLGILDSFYEQFNQGTDSVAAESMRQRLMEMLIPRLDPAVDRKGQYYGIYMRQLSLILDELWDDIFAAAADISYPEFLSSGDFLYIKNSADYYLGFNSTLYQSVDLDWYGRLIDKDALKALLSELDFEKKDVAIYREAAVGAYRMMPLFLTGGRDASGNAYLVSYGYAARLTDEQLHRFVEICSGKIIPDYCPDATYTDFYIEYDRYTAERISRLSD
jgi:hypothetical protein